MPISLSHRRHDSLSSRSRCRRPYIPARHNKQGSLQECGRRRLILRPARFIGQRRQTISSLHAKSTLSQGWATFNDPTSFLSPNSKAGSYLTYCFFQLQSVCSPHSPFNTFISWSSLLPHSFGKSIDSIPTPATVHLPTFQPPTVTLFIHSPYPGSETKSPVVRLGMLETRVPDSSFHQYMCFGPGFRLISGVTRRILR